MEGQLHKHLFHLIRAQTLANEPIVAQALRFISWIIQFLLDYQTSLTRLNTLEVYLLDNIVPFRWNVSLYSHLRSEGHLELIGIRDNNIIYAKWLQHQQDRASYCWYNSIYLFISPITGTITRPYDLSLSIVVTALYQLKQIIQSISC